MVQIRWDLLGPPVDAGGAVMRGFAQGSALRRQRDEETRRDQFQQSALAAYDTQTGRIDPVAMRSAFAQAGDIEGAMRFDQSNAETTRSQQAAAREQMLTMARLLDDSTDQASYDRSRAIAERMGIDVSQAPPSFDPEWVAQQRQIVREFVERPQEMTAFMREAEAAGVQPGTPEFRAVFNRRYNSPRYYPLQPGGRLELDPSYSGSDAPPRGEPPPELTDEDFEDGGPSPRGSGGFP